MHVSESKIINTHLTVGCISKTVQIKHLVEVYIFSESLFASMVKLYIQKLKIYR